MKAVSISVSATGGWSAFAEATPSGPFMGPDMTVSAVFLEQLTATTTSPTLQPIAVHLTNDLEGCMTISLSSGYVRLRLHCLPRNASTADRHLRSVALSRCRKAI